MLAAETEPSGLCDDDMSDYWHKNWTCPFFTRSDKTRVICEGGCVQSFPDKLTAQQFMRRYCASKSNGWQCCSMASSLLNYYEGRGDQEYEQSTED